MGCGRVGSTLARAVEKREHTVAVIDQNPDAFRRLGPAFSGRKVTGPGFDQRVLVQAGIEQCQAFAAVSSGDNSNIITARVAREEFGVENVVARSYHPGPPEVYERLGIPTVATVRWTADQMLARLLPTGTPQWRDPSGTIRIDQRAASPAWIGRRLADLEVMSGARVAYLTRLGQGQLPTAETVLQEGDLLHLVMREADAPKVSAVYEQGGDEL